MENVSSLTGLIHYLVVYICFVFLDQSNPKYSQKVRNRAAASRVVFNILEYSSLKFLDKSGDRKLSGIMMVGDERDYHGCTHMLLGFLHKLW